MESNRRPPPPSPPRNRPRHLSDALFRARLQFLYHRRLDLGRAALRAKLQTLQFQLENVPSSPPRPPNSNLPPNRSIRPPPPSSPSADAYENVSKLVAKLKQNLAASKAESALASSQPQQGNRSFHQGHSAAVLAAIRHNTLPPTPSSSSPNLPVPVEQLLGIDRGELENTARRYFSQEFQALRFSAPPDQPCIYFEPSESTDTLAIDINSQSSGDDLPENELNSIRDINSTNTNMQPFHDNPSGKEPNSAQDIDIKRNSSSRLPLYVKVGSSSKSTVATHGLVPTSHNMFYMEYGRQDSKEVWMGGSRGHAAYASAEESGRKTEGRSSGAKDLSKTVSPTSTPTSLIHLQNNSTKRRRAFFQRSAEAEPFVVPELPGEVDDDAVFEIDCTGNVKRTK